jgi:hypothetical protein
MAILIIPTAIGRIKSNFLLLFIVLAPFYFDFLSSGRLSDLGNINLNFLQLGSITASR